jgi:tRNA(fMet)-specific endonuclease VapC
MRFLLDTCAVSEMVARRPSPAVLEWLRAQRASDLYLSVVTLGELQKGIAKLPSCERRDELERWLGTAVLDQFGGRLLGLDVPTMLRWGVLVAECEARGRAVCALDSLLAATALHHGLTVVTRNESDFTPTGVAVVNPWNSVT